MKYTKEIVGRMVTYFTQKLGVFPYRTGWLRQGTCPSCGKPKKFGINLYNNRTNCFACGYHPTPPLLLMKLEDLPTYADIYKFLNGFEEATYLETNLPILEQKEVKLPRDFKLLGIDDTNIGIKAVAYMKDRGYNIGNLQMRGVGYCTKGEYKYRIIIPFYERGELIYFNARQFIQLGSKHKNPPTDEFGIGKSLIIYNVDAIHIYNRIYILESVTNALTLGDNAIATGGKLASTYQLSKIIKSPCKEVIILWDPDAYWEGLQLGMKLANHKKTKVVRLPDYWNINGKLKENPDVNDLGRKETLAFIKSTPWQSYQDLYRIFIRTPKPFYKLPIA
jgi:hypothetical protein